MLYFVKQYFVKQTSKCRPCLILLGVRVTTLSNIYQQYDTCTLAIHPYCKYKYQMQLCVGQMYLVTCVFVTLCMVDYLLTYLSTLYAQFWIEKITFYMRNCYLSICSWYSKYSFRICTYFMNYLPTIVLMLNVSRPGLRGGLVNSEMVTVITCYTRVIVH